SSCVSINPFPFTVAPTPELYTLSLHDALPISSIGRRRHILPHGAAWHSGRGHRRAARSGAEHNRSQPSAARSGRRTAGCDCARRSEEHTSELQSRGHLVCRLLLEKKKSEYTVS